MCHSFTLLAYITTATSDSCFLAQTETKSCSGINIKSSLQEETAELLRFPALKYTVEGRELVQNSHDI